MTFLVINSFAINQIITYDFVNEIENSTILLRNFTGMFRPQIIHSSIRLTNGGYAKKHNNAVIFPMMIDDTSEIEHYSFSLYISRGAEGAGFALVNTNYAFDDSLSFKAESWEMPNFEKSFGLGIDVYNPQTSHWFDEWGNFYGREEREISLHWDNKEIFKMMSPVEFRADLMASSFKTFDITIQYITAGALINLAIEDTVVIHNYFIPEMCQYNKQAVFGASTSELTTTVILDSFTFLTEGKAPEYHIIESVTLMKNEVFHSQRQNVEGLVFFPDAVVNADKVILILDLSGPDGGVSDWDVGASIYLTDDDGTKYEILRYITPYRRPYKWKVDISDFLPLFKGSKEVSAHISTWEPKQEDPKEQKGWKVTAHLDFYRGFVEKKAFAIENLWSGNFEYGNPEEPMKENLRDFYIKIPNDSKSAILRIVTTGHGMSPNFENAAEFRPADRWVIINNVKYHNLLWKTDNYLNPCRPQDGTWKFDRAGWAPGDIVRAWEIDLDQYLQEEFLEISYIPDDYINHTRGSTWEPFHKIEAQVIFFK